MSINRTSIGSIQLAEASRIAPSVAFRFFKESLNRAIVVQVGENRYSGILFSAPDRKEDSYVILKRVVLLPPRTGEPAEPEALPLIESLLIKIDDFREVQALRPEVLRRI